MFEKIDGRGYKAYRELFGRTFRVGNFFLRVEKVQPDPFAPPSVVSLSFPLPFSVEEPIPVADLMHRKIFSLQGKFSRKIGEGKSGIVALPKPSSIVVPRTSVEIQGRNAIVRLWVGLPSRRRRVLGEEARKLLLENVPALLYRALGEITPSELNNVQELWKDQEYVRKWLRENGYAFFVAEGSILPRVCPLCDDPLPDAVPFEPPTRYTEEIHLPSGRVVRGLVGKKVTLVTGPAFHGKTTLLEAVYTGVWNRRLGDGREFVVADENSFYVESENGRWVSCVDVSSFIFSIPRGGNVSCFSTSDASGATSVAASIQEAVEGGASHILLDEDATATNFLHRDVLAEKLTGKVTVASLSDVAESLPFHLTVVAGGSYRLAARAERIVVMDEYRSRDGESVKEYAKEIDRTLGSEAFPYGEPSPRRVKKVPKLGKWKIRGRRLYLPAGEVDLSRNRQLQECPQVKASVILALGLLREGLTFKDVREKVEGFWRWKLPVRYVSPDLAYVRPLDVWFVLNRLPGLVFERVRSS